MMVLLCIVVAAGGLLVGVLISWAMFGKKEEEREKREWRQLKKEREGEKKHSNEKS